MSKLYMGFDAGTQSVKVAVYDEQFNCLTSHSLPTHLHYPQPGWVEMSADEFLEITVKSMAACAQSLREMGRDPKDVCAVMGDGIICGIVGVNPDGDAVTPYINYLDSRTTPDVEALNARELEIWGRETGNPVASPMFPAMFARWFLKNNEAFNRDGVKFVHNAPYISRASRARTPSSTGAPCPAGAWATTSRKSAGPTNSSKFSASTGSTCPKS